MNYVKYLIETLQMNAAGLAPTTVKGSIVACVEFYNGGATVAYINGRPLPVGASWSPVANIGEVDISRYQVTFAAPGTGVLFVTRKILQ